MPRPLSIASELMLCPTQNGVTLIQPEKIASKGYDIKHNSSLSTVGNLFANSFAVYFENTDNITQKCNDISAKECGFDSSEACINQLWYKHFAAHTIAPALANHSSVLIEKNTQITYENATRNDNSSHDALNIRMPWYNNKNQIIGIFGCAIIIGINPLAESLTHISQLGLLNLSQWKQTNYLLGTEINSVYLSKREMECLHLTIRGNTAKTISKILGLSKWTVEEYLSNIKLKMGVSSKTELIDKTIDYFFSKNFK